MRITVKYMAEYVCAHCGRAELGTALYDEFEAYSVIEAQERIARGATPRPFGMPLNWGNYPDGFRCPRCSNNGGPV